VLQEGVGERRQGHHRDAAHSLYPFLSSPNTSSQTEVLDTCQHLCFNDKPSIILQISSDEVDGVDDGSTSTAPASADDADVVSDAICSTIAFRALPLFLLLDGTWIWSAGEGWLKKLSLCRMTVLSKVTSEQLSTLRSVSSLSSLHATTATATSFFSFNINSVFSSY
jgi:hypothetical protein